MKNSFKTVVIVLLVSFIIYTLILKKKRVENFEANHVIQHDECIVVMDTAKKIRCIWYKDMPYVLDTTIFVNL